ncbi:MAG: hypothetical protein JSS83_17425 [Cyanobacteria bacterium SZAS LIN-3]|nr:hypothetical protein [Cyanobacteria bacterium SZAS LIN-3]
MAAEQEKKEKNTGKAYEAEIKEVYTAIHKLEGVGPYGIELNEEIAGVTKKRDGTPMDHEIDVNWVAVVEETEARTVIQGKDLAKDKVKKLEMMGFERTVADIPNSQGIFVAQAGYQSGALEWAIAKGIEANELRNPTEEELANRVQHIRLEFVFLPRTFLAAYDWKLNLNWLTSLTAAQRNLLSKHFLISPKTVKARTISNPVPKPLYLFAMEAEDVAADFEGAYEKELRFSEPVVLTNAGLPFNILVDGFTYKFSVGPAQVSEIAVDADLPRIVRNVTGGQSYMIAEIDGARRAVKVEDLPPTKFTPAANPKKPKKSKKKRDEKTDETA